MPPRPRFARLLVFPVLLVLTGCASEREQLEEERCSLYQDRNAIQTDLSSQLPGSRWNDHPDTDRMIESVGTIDQRIEEINHRLGELP